MAKDTKTEKVLKLARQLGVLRPKDAAEHGIAPMYLQRLKERGLLTQTARGIYMLAEHDATEHHTLAQASKRVPHGVICLLSALQFHGLTTQWPPEVWMAIDRKSRRPEGTGLPLRFVRFSERVLREGSEEHRLEGVAVRVTNPAKTVADCFKYRNKVGLDVALEALRDCWRRKKATMDELWKYAKVCRVSNVIRPYMESLA